jgi:hypothetical protein
MRDQRIRDTFGIQRGIDGPDQRGQHVGARKPRAQAALQRPEPTGEIRARRHR